MLHGDTMFEFDLGNRIFDLRPFLSHLAHPLAWCVFIAFRLLSLAARSALIWLGSSLPRQTITTGVTLVNHS